MASLSSIRTAVKTTLEAGITLIKVYPTARTVTVIPEGGAAVVVAPSTADFVVAMGRGTDTWAFDLWVMVNTADDELAQNVLDGFVTGDGTNSIREAIFNARTLGLSGTDAHVSGMSGYGLRFESAGIPHLGATLNLTVHTPGTS